MSKVAYYTGCLAALSAKELNTSTKALAPKLGIELDELESVTCCGAGDIHEAEPDYYLHLNARILAYAEATGNETLMTICNVCTLNLRQANWQLKNDDNLRARVSQNETHPVQHRLLRSQGRRQQLARPAIPAHVQHDIRESASDIGGKPHLGSLKHCHISEPLAERTKST